MQSTINYCIVLKPNSYIREALQLVYPKSHDLSNLITKLTCYDCIRFSVKIFFFTKFKHIYTILNTK